MKGICIIELTEDNELILISQFPPNISKDLNVENSDFENLYSLHLKQKDKPNFFQLEIKEINIASFFTGPSLNYFVGEPNYIIVLFLEKTELDLDQNNITKDIEGMVRRIAYELIPQNDAEKFENTLENYFLMLQNNDLEPYWEEYIDGELKKIEKESPKKIVEEKEIKEYQEIKVEEIADKEVLEVQKIEASKNEIATRGYETENKETPVNEIKTEEFIVKSETDLKDKNIIQEKKETEEEHYDKLEKQVLEQEIEDLKLQLKEKTDKIRELTMKMAENQSEIARLEDFKEIGEKAKEEINKSIDLNNKQKEDLEFKNKKIDELNLNINKFENLIKEKEKNTENLVKEKEKNIENLKGEIQKVKKDNDTYIDSISSLKIKLRDQENKNDEIQKKSSDDLIELKKEIKVLRRERDHYKKIIKDGLKI